MNFYGSKKYTTSTKNTVLGAIYRRPGSDPTEFNNKLAETINKIESEKKNCIHMGDFNLKLLNSENHSPTLEFRYKLFSFPISRH